MSTEREATRRIDRWSGACLIASGILVLPTALHPDVFESTFGEAALDTPLWVPIHVALLVAMILSLIALLGLYARRAERLGRLGAIGFALAVIGLVMGACAFYWEAVLLPPLARQSPELFDWDGPVVSSWGVRAGALAGLWFVGFLLLGFALWRAGVVPVAPALTFAITAVAFAALDGPFVPVLGPLSVVAFGIGYAWVGVALWTGASGRPSPADQRPAPHPAVPTGSG